MISKNWQRFLFIVSIISVIGLLGFAYLGQYIRPMADDLYYMSFDGSPPLRGFDLLTNGRVSALILYGFFYKLPLFLRIVPLLSITIVLAGFFIPTYLLLKKYINTQYDRVLLTVATSATATFSAVLFTPGLYSSIFWAAAAPVHVWSYGLISIYGGVLLYFWRKKTLPNWTISVLILILLPLFIGTLYETAAILLILISLYILTITIIKQAEWYRRVAALSIVSSVGSLLILWFSPGAQSRRSIVSESDTSSMIEKVFQLPRVFWHIIKNAPTIFDRWGVLVVLLAISFLIGMFCLKRNLRPKKAITFIALIIFGALFVSMLNIAIIFIAVGSQNPPLRAYFIVAAVLCATSVAIGLIAGSSLKQIPLFWRGTACGVLTTAAVIVLLTSLFFIPYVRHYRGDLKLHAIAWDKRDTHIRDVLTKHPNVCNLRVENLPLSGVHGLSTQKNSWKNNGLTSYYYTKVRYNDSCTIYANN